MTQDWRDSVELTEQQSLVRRSVRDLCAEFGDEYWRERDRTATYPTEFVDALADDGWLGMLVSEEYGGVGMSTSEAVVMMEEIAASGGGFAGPQSIHGGIYNSVPIVKYADEELKADLLPRVADGDARIQAFGLTEPNAGSDSTAMETRAERDGDEYVVNGEKVWISRVEDSDYLLLMARTTPRDEVEKRTRGISMILVDLEEAYGNGLEIERIPKTASRAVHSYQLYFDDLRVPARNLIGEEGEGFYQVLDGLNEERLVIAAECLGLGEVALERGIEYANEREVFGSPIGANQAVQHPLAEAYADLLAAKKVIYSAADRLDDLERTAAGAEANVAKYLAAEAAFEAADAAVQTHGGFGVAREYDVERYFREARLTRLVPVTQQLALNYLGERVLGLPRSY
ncbi:MULTISPECIES: acyl-CoA dehydrogenase family protein [unclassified Halorubrum]|uniref:acyl-CoA dehydrogenase family protein n=1 Tax=unclassified Halorubrum TaxID=2642239 RepID=UPI0010F47D9F|nr:MULTISPECIES: acyl-CoA dehydrogenase family protein [unclassified Halorubrum]TKX44517.1 acyl-CoA dehydrogenase [Halorubrum sp. ARQ200]TKX48602.1 acyl-CoA dehydrogenase [Halorubrum sp. ASP121]TKX62865.1 acyl-CoA dehydrogenase [Halorubrum sp. ASP1]